MSPTTNTSGWPQHATAFAVPRHQPDAHVLAIGERLGRNLSGIEHRLGPCAQRVDAVRAARAQLVVGVQQPDRAGARFEDVEREVGRDLAQGLEAAGGDQLRRTRDEAPQLTRVTVSLGLGARRGSLRATKRDRELDRAAQAARVE
jgi:hypothetical protein